MNLEASQTVDVCIVTSHDISIRHDFAKTEIEEIPSLRLFVMYRRRNSKRTILWV